MRQLLADTRFLIALVDAGDVHPAEAVAFLRQLRKAVVIVTDYSLFAGIAFLATAMVLIAPIAHRFLHQFHRRGVTSPCQALPSFSVPPRSE